MIFDGSHAPQTPRLSFNAPVDNDESVVARESELHFEGAIPKALPAEEEVTPVDKIGRAHV